MNMEEVKMLQELKSGERTFAGVFNYYGFQRFTPQFKRECVDEIKKKIQKKEMSIKDIPRDLLRSQRYCLMFADEYTQGIKNGTIQIADVPKWLLSDQTFCFSIKDECIKGINEGRMKIADIPNYLLRDTDFCFGIKDKYMQEIKDGKIEIGDVPRALLQRREAVRELVIIPFPQGKERNYFNNKILRRMPEEFVTDIAILVPYLQQIKELYPNDSSNNYDMLNYIEGRFGKKFLDNNPEIKEALIKEGVITEQGITDRKNKNTHLESQDERRKRIKRILEAAKDSELRDLISTLGITQNDLDDEYIINNLLFREPEFFSVLSPLKKCDSRFQKSIAKRFPLVKPKIDEYNAYINRRQEQYEEEKKRKSEEKRKDSSDKQNGNFADTSAELKAEYLQQREKHPDIRLILEFLNSGKSRKRFCQDIKITEQDFMNKVNQVGMVYPTLKEAVEFVLRQFQEAFKRYIRAIVEELCSGRLTIKDFATNNIGPIKVRGLLDFAKKEGQEEKMKLLILEAMKSGTLTMMDYVRLFSMQKTVEDVEQEIRTFFNTLNDSVNEKSSATKQADNRIDENASEIAVSNNKIDEKRRYR